jgi:hypothetical protein
VADLSAFCERNPDVCVAGGAAIDLFTEKAENGVRLLYRYFDEDGKEKPADVEGAKGTLNGEDLALPWRGPEPDAPA